MCFRVVAIIVFLFHSIFKPKINRKWWIFSNRRRKKNYLVYEFAFDLSFRSLHAIPYIRRLFRCQAEPIEIGVCIFYISSPTMDVCVCVFM